MDCLVEALAGNVRQARLMKNTPPLRGAFRLPFATAHGPSVPAPSGQPPLQGGLTARLFFSPPLQGEVPPKAAEGFALGPLSPQPPCIEQTTGKGVMSRILSIVAASILGRLYGIIVLTSRR